MITYVYCSYNGSPCGYRLGKFDSNQKKNIIRLDNEGINPVIIKVLKNDFIKTAYGKIPNTNEYIVVLKDLEYEPQKDGDARDVSKKYFNFVFGFESAELAYNFSSELMMSIRTNIDKQLGYFYSFIVVDKKDKDFGLVIDKEVFDKWIDGIEGR